MVNANVKSSARGVQNALDDRNVMAIGALSLLGVGGVFLGEEVSEQVLPLVGFSSDPSDMTGLAASAATKLGGAMALGILGSRLGGTGKAAAGVVSFGMLVSMGLDVIDAAGGIPGMSATSTSSSSAPTPTPQPTGSNPQPVRRASSGPSTGNIDNGSIR